MVRIFKRRSERVWLQNIDEQDLVSFDDPEGIQSRSFLARLCL